MAWPWTTLKVGELRTVRRHSMTMTMKKKTPSMRVGSANRSQTFLDSIVTGQRMWAYSCTTRRLSTVMVVLRHLRNTSTTPLLLDTPQSFYLANLYLRCRLLCHPELVSEYEFGCSSGHWELYARQTRKNPGSTHLFLYLNWIMSTKEHQFISWIQPPILGTLR